MSRSSCPDREGRDVVSEEEFQRFVLDRLDRIEHKLQQGVVRDAYSVDQAAERLRMSPWTVRQACNKKRIAATKARNGRDWRIPHDELVRVEAEGL